MSGEENSPSPKAVVPQCQFFVQRKKRLCRMTVKPGRQYCGEHEPQLRTETGQIDKRIPCPNDPKHSCYASKLLKHLAICNARRTEQPPYIVENINAPEAVQTCPRLSLNTYPKDVLSNVIDKVNHLYAKHVEGRITTEPPSPIHRAVLPEFSAPDRAESSLRHLRQVSALLWCAERAPLPAPRACYVELGAGKGQLSYYAAHAWCAGTGSRVLAVDRAPLRHKRDNKLRSTPPTHPGNTQYSQEQDKQDLNNTEVNISVDTNVNNTEVNIINVDTNNKQNLSSDNGSKIQTHSDINGTDDGVNNTDVNTTEHNRIDAINDGSDNGNGNAINAARKSNNDSTDSPKGSAENKVLDEVMEVNETCNREKDSKLRKGEGGQIISGTDKEGSVNVSNRQRAKKGESRRVDTESSVSESGSNRQSVKEGESRHSASGRTDSDRSSDDVAVRLRADLAHLALEAVPVVAESDAVVGLAKHLCGVATDYALRCIAAPGVVSKTKGLVLATCCHHRVERAPYVANQQLQELGINAEEFNIMLGIVSWATCGDGRSRERRLGQPGVAGGRQGEREEAGRRAKALLDWGRVLWLRGRGFDAGLCYYVPRDVSLENVAIVAVKR